MPRQVKASSGAKRVGCWWLSHLASVDEFDVTYYPHVIYGWHCNLTPSICQSAFFFFGSKLVDLKLATPKLLAARKTKTSRGQMSC